MLAGGGVVNAIVIALTITAAVAVTVFTLVEVAVIVTAPGVAGAVHTLITPLAVCAGLNEPQGDGAQVQSTPSAWLSFVTVAAMLAVCDKSTCEGGALVIATVTALTVTLAVAMTVAWPVAVAVIVTAPGVVGVVQTVVPPLAVCAGTNAPQGDGVQVQSTPAS